MRRSTKSEKSFGVKSDMQSQTGQICYNNPVDEYEERFHKLMTILAARCNTELDELEIELYDRKLCGHGYERVCQALENILIDRSSNDAFPSVGAILSRMGVQMTPKTLAMEVTNRIVTAIHTKGYTWPDRFKTKQDFNNDQLRVLGEAGYALVTRLGGWAAVIEFANGNPSHYRTWVRDSALAMVESTGTSMLKALPEAPAPLAIENQKTSTK